LPVFKWFLIWKIEFQKSHLPIPYTLAPEFAQQYVDHLTADTEWILKNAVMESKGVYHAIGLRD